MENLITYPNTIGKVLPEFGLSYQDTVLSGINMTKERVIREVMKSIVGHYPTLEEMKDVRMIQINVNNNRENKIVQWVMYQGKSIGFITTSFPIFCTGSTGSNSVHITFTYSENPVMDKQVAESDIAQQQAIEKERKDVWELIKPFVKDSVKENDAVDMIIHYFTKK